jgi:hypothetical protein
VSNLVVLAFDSEAGAKQMIKRVDNLQKMQLLQLDDAETVVRNADGKAKVTQAHSLVGAGAFGGAFWGMLIGLLFWMPSHRLRVLAYEAFLACLAPQAREPSLMGSYQAHTASPLFLGLTLDESEIHSHGQAPGVVAGVAAPLLAAMPGPVC